MRFLHEKKEVKKTLGLQDKFVLSKYNRDRHEKKIDKIKKDSKNGFVTKNDWELVMGFPSESYFHSNNNSANKYIKKFGEYQGSHAKRDRR